MIKSGMFVRCSIDNEKYPRDYAIGKVKAVNEFSELVDVEFNDISDSFNNIILDQLHYR